MPADDHADGHTEWGWLSTDQTTVYASTGEQAARTAASRSGARVLMRRRIGPWQPVTTTDTTEETPA